MAKNKILQIRISEEENLCLKEKADKENITVSKYVTRKIFDVGESDKSKKRYEK